MVEHVASRRIGEFHKIFEYGNEYAHRNVSDGISVLDVFDCRISSPSASNHSRSGSQRWVVNRIVWGKINAVGKCFRIFCDGWLWTLCMGFVSCHWPLHSDRASHT